MVSEGLETRAGQLGLGELSGRLYDLVREHPDFEALDQPRPDVSRFRYVPNALAERQEEPDVQAKLDRLNREIVEAVRQSGTRLVMTTRIHGRVAIQTSLYSGTFGDHVDVTGEEIDALFEAIARWGRLLSMKLP